jgi:hypothetical protein
MVQKNELAMLIAQTVYDLVACSEIDWDSIYFRFYCDGVDHSSSQFTYRKHRELNPVKGGPKHRELLRKLMLALFAQAEKETGRRPLVAVVKVKVDKNYDIAFNYDDPSAFDISLPGLGRAESYFSDGEIDIPDEVKEFQSNLEKKGLSHMPMFYNPSKTR